MKHRTSQVLSSLQVALSDLLSPPRPTYQLLWSGLPSFHYDIIESRVKEKDGDGYKYFHQGEKPSMTINIFAVCWLQAICVTAKCGKTIKKQWGQGFLSLLSNNLTVKFYDLILRDDCV